MAKAKTLAALAGLAGLAYAYNKNKNKDDSSTTDSKSGETTSSKKDADDNDTLARVNREEASGITKSKSDVLKALAAPKTAPNDKAPSQGVLPPKTVTPPKVKPKSEPAKETPSDRRNLESGMSRGTRPAVAKDPNYSNEGRNSVAPAKNPNYSNEGRSSTAPTIASKVGNIAKNTAVAAVKAANPVATAAYEFGTTPTSEQASANRQEAYDKVKSVGSKVVDYVKNFETPAERRSREAKEASGMKRGGSVNMASGGMTASRRGDGIASRGKTRGKIC
jgi:hypothetical protein